MPGNTSDKTTLQSFLKKIEKQYGKAQRTWVMDRGIPTEETLEQMRSQDPPIHYLVGTPKGRLKEYEQRLTQLPWESVREGVEVKLLPEDGEIYVLAKSSPRVDKERAIRRRQLKKLWQRLKQLRSMNINRDQLLLKLGAARQQSPSAWRLVKIKLPQQTGSWEFSLDKKKLRDTAPAVRAAICYEPILRAKSPTHLWKLYTQLTQVEEAFKNLKCDLAIRPIHHQREDRIEAHIFITFLAYCLQVSLNRRLRDLAPGLSARSVLEKLSSIQMIDVHLPTTDGRKVILSRYTQPEKEVQMLLQELKLTLPEQPPPKITTLSNPPGSDV